MRYKYRYLDAVHYIEELDKDKSSYIFSIDNDIKKENDFLLRHGRPPLNDKHVMAYTRCKRWLLKNHPELLL